MRSFVSVLALSLFSAAIAPAEAHASSPQAFVEINVQLGGFPEGTRVREAHAITRTAETLNPFCRDKKAAPPAELGVAELAGGTFHVYGKYERGRFCPSALQAVRFEVVSTDSQGGEVRLPVEILRELRSPASTGDRRSLNELRVRCARNGEGPFECETVTDQDVLKREHMQVIVPDESSSPILRMENLRIDLS